MKNKMYYWEGLSRHGEKLSGELLAPDAISAKYTLYKQDILVRRIWKEKVNIFRNKITSDELTLFIRQLSTMLQVGISLPSAFDITAKSQTNSMIKILCKNTKNNLESGMTLHESFSHYPQYFNELVINLIHVGETVGCLELILNKIADYQEKMQRIRKKIKKACFYPGVILTIGLLITFGLLIYIVPQFETLFKNFGSELPVITRSIIETSRFLKNHLFFILGIFSILFLLVSKMKKYSSKFSITIDRWILRIPFIGNIIQNSCLARFAYTLSITLTAGLPLIKALEAVAKSTGNYVYEKTTLKIQKEVSTGQKIQNALENSKIFPGLFIQMVAIGEESGSLETMLQKSAIFYQESVDNAIDHLSTLIEPLIMFILGILVMGLLVAMYLPIFRLGSVM